jgi:hypothetical protein
VTDHEEPGWDLVMPFVVCASQGGPYDDRSFVAGYQLGRLDRDLGVLAALEFASVSRVLYTDSLAQADLIGMRHGYRMERGYEHDRWSDVDFLAAEPADG